MRLTLFAAMVLFIALVACNHPGYKYSVPNYHPGQRVLLKTGEEATITASRPTPYPGDKPAYSTGYTIRISYEVPESWIYEFEIEKLIE